MPCILKPVYKFCCLPMSVRFTKPSDVSLKIMIAVGISYSHAQDQAMVLSYRSYLLSRELTRAQISCSELITSSVVKFCIVIIEEEIFGHIFQGSKSDHDHFKHLKLCFQKRFFYFQPKYANRNLNLQSTTQHVCIQVHQMCLRACEHFHTIVVY